MADFDAEVVGIAAQPFLVRDADRRHVPDFLLHRADGSVLIVNVKPAQQLAVERVADALAWAGRVFGDRGWEHEVWSGADAQLLANVRFLRATGARRCEPAPRAATVLTAGSGLTVTAAEAALRDAGETEPRPVVLGLLWSGRLRADLAQPLVGRHRTGGAVVSVTCLTVGSRITYDGGVWTVLALAGDLVTVQEQRSGRALSLRACSLLAAPDSAVLGGGVIGPVGGVGAHLASLTAAELAVVCERAGHVREVLTGYRSGSAQDALEGEPRAEYRPGVPLMDRYRAKTQELGIGERTLRRWVRAFELDGEAGLDRRSPPAAQRAAWQRRFSLAGRAAGGAG